MAYREVHCVEIREIVGRWQAGLSQRRIARGTVSIARVIEPRVATVIGPPGTPVGGLISVSV